MGMLACTDTFPSDGTTGMSKQGDSLDCEYLSAARKLLCSEVTRRLISMVMPIRRHSGLLYTHSRHAGFGMSTIDFFMNDK